MYDCEYNGIEILNNFFRFKDINKSKVRCGSGFSFIVILCVWF